MALKSKIDKATYDALKPDVKAEYKAEGDDFILDVEELDSLPAVVSMKEALARAKANEVAEHKKTKDKLTVSEARVVELEGADTTRTNDTKAIEARGKKALDDAKLAHDAELKKRDDALATLLITNKAQEIAAEISNSPDVILPHIVKRLKADLSGDVPTTVVVGEDGSDSTLTIDALKKEMVANKKFAAIIIGSKASGSGARRTQGGAVPQNKKFGELSDVERTAWHKEDPTGFNEASETYQREQRGY